MRTKASAVRFALPLLFAGLCATAGCGYVHDRVRDALDMVDIGITLTKTPSIAAFKACTGLACVGYGNLKGYFVGLGGGRFEMSRYESKSVGYGLWGKQKTELKDSDDESSATEPDETVNEFEETGLIAAAEGKSKNAACIQQLHLGWAGIIFNIKWTEILDFVVGWSTVDLCKDDGVERQGWFAKKKLAPAEEAAASAAAVREGSVKLVHAHDTRTKTP